jgi:hypothetical protein
VPVSAAPQEGQVRIFSATTIEQAGHLFIGPVSYTTYLTAPEMILPA